jgi:O-antigen/teichoic acid export membrane protein
MDLTLVGKDVIRLLLGPGWGPAGRIFTFFGPGIGIMLLYGTHGWIHLSIGRADRWLRWGIIEVVVTGLLFLGGLHWGPEGIAVAWTASFWILTFPALWYAGKPIGLSLGPMIAAVWKYIVASLLAGCASAAIVRSPSLVAAPGPGGAFLGILAISLLSGALYLLAVVALHRGFAPVYQLLNLLREMVPWKRRPTSPQAATQITEPGVSETRALELVEKE